MASVQRAACAGPPRSRPAPGERLIRNPARENISGIESSSQYMITRHYYYTDNTTHRYTGKYQHLRLVNL